MTLTELRSFIEGAGLQPDEFAVLTSDEEMNGLGLPLQRHREAKVLFTTQAMIRSRARGKSFADASDFHFQGEPRSLRIWDEDILLSEARIIRRDDLAALPSFVRPRMPELANELTDFCLTVDALEAGQTIHIPSGLLASRSNLAAACGQVGLENYRGTLETMHLMAGSEMLVHTGDYFGKELIGVRTVLPDDVAPLVVVDASGRVRDAYDVWKEHRGNLVPLSSAGNSYHQLNVHFWQHGSGKDALEDEPTRAKFAAAIVDAFNRDPTGRWLILTHQDAKDALKDSIFALSPPISEDRLHWLHWGRHRSTNDFKDVEHIVIVGLNHYRQSDYLGLSFAASGLPVSETKYPDPSILRLGELKHHLLQAICRISVRKSRGGVAPPANAFVIGKLADAEDFFESVFPGHSFVKWKEDEPNPKDRVQKAIAYVRAKLRSGDDNVRKKELRDALGLSSAQALNRVLNTTDFVAFMREVGLTSSGQRLLPATSEFDPIEDN